MKILSITEKSTLQLQVKILIGEIDKGEKLGALRQFGILKNKWEVDVLSDNNVFHSRIFFSEKGKTAIEAAMEHNAYALIAAFLPYCPSLPDLNETIAYSFIKTARAGLSNNQIFITDQILHKANNIQQLLQLAIQKRDNDMVVTLAASAEATPEVLQNLLLKIVNAELPNDFDLDEIAECIVKHIKFVFTADTVTILEAALENNNLMLANHIVKNHGLAELDKAVDNGRYQAAKESLNSALANNSNNNNTNNAAAANTATSSLPMVATSDKNDAVVLASCTQVSSGIFESLPSDCQEYCKQAINKVFAALKTGEFESAAASIRRILADLNTKYSKYLEESSDVDSAASDAGDDDASNFVEAFNLLNKFRTANDETVLDVALEKKNYYVAQTILCTYGAKFRLLRKSHIQTYLKEAAAERQWWIVSAIFKAADNENDRSNYFDRAIDDQDVNLVRYIAGNRLLNKVLTIERFQRADKLNSTEIYSIMFNRLADKQAKLWVILFCAEVNMHYKTDLINTVLRAGANPLLKDGDGDIPLVYALRRKKTAIVNAILSSEYFEKSCVLFADDSDDDSDSDDDNQAYGTKTYAKFLGNFIKVVITAIVTSNVEALHQLGRLFKSLEKDLASLFINGFRLSLTPAVVHAISKQQFSVLKALFIGFNLSTTARVSGRDAYATLFSHGVEQNHPEFNEMVKSFFSDENINDAWVFALKAKPPQYKVIDLILETRANSVHEKNFTIAIDILRNDEKFSLEKLLIKAPEAVIRHALYAAINKMTSEDIQVRKRTIAFIAELFKCRKESCDKSHVEFSKEAIISAIDHGHSDLAIWMISPAANWNNILLVALRNEEYDIATALCRKGAVLSASSFQLQGLLKASVTKNLGNGSLLAAGAIVTHADFEFTDDTVTTLEIAMRTNQDALAILIVGAYKNTKLSADAQQRLQKAKAWLDNYDPTITEKPVAKQQEESLLDKVHNAIEKQNFNLAEYQLARFKDEDIASIDDRFDGKTVLQILLERGGSWRMWNTDINPAATNSYYELAKSLHAKGANPSELRKEALGVFLLDAVKENDLDIVNIILASNRFSYDEHATKALEVANQREQTDIVAAIKMKQPGAKAKTASKLPQHLSLLMAQEEQDLSQGAEIPVLLSQAIEMKDANADNSTNGDASYNNDDDPSAASEKSIVVVSSPTADVIVATQKPTTVTVVDKPSSAVEGLDMLKAFFANMRKDEPVNTVTSALTIEASKPIEMTHK